MVRIGNRIIRQDALTDGHFVMVDSSPDTLRSPDVCPPAIDTTPPYDFFNVPTGHGNARILGVADLMVLEQELLRHQLGKIAHIENVMKSEERSREFKTTDMTKQTLTIETEITEEKSQDLSSTERFELQTESRRSSTPT